MSLESAGGKKKRNGVLNTIRAAALGSMVVGGSLPAEAQNSEPNPYTHAFKGGTSEIKTDPNNPFLGALNGEAKKPAVDSNNPYADMLKKTPPKEKIGGEKNPYIDILKKHKGNQE